VAQTGTLTGLPATSSAVGPVTAPNDAPVASNVQITGDLQEGAVLTGSYSYADTEGDLEGTSTYRWLSDGVAIPGATTLTYQLVAGDVGALITFEVTPVAQTGTLTGLPATSTPPAGPVIGPLDVIGLDQPSMPRGSVMNVTISGANFLDGATVSFDPGQGPAPVVSNVVVVNDTTITATFETKTGGPKGTLLWDLRVTNPGGSTDVLVGGLTILP